MLPPWEQLKTKANQTSERLNYLLDSFLIQTIQIARIVDLGNQISWQLVLR